MSFKVIPSALCVVLAVVCLPLAVLSQADADDNICCFPDKISGNIYEPMQTVNFYIDLEGKWALSSAGDPRTTTYAYDLEARTIIAPQLDGSCKTFPLTKDFRIVRSRCIPSNAVMTNGDEYQYPVDDYMTKAYMVKSTDGVCTPPYVSLTDKRSGEVWVSLNKAGGTTALFDMYRNNYVKLMEKCNGAKNE